MSSLAQGRCAFCTQKHTLSVFGSGEVEHDLIQKLNLKFILLNTVCRPCIATVGDILKKVNLRLPFLDITAKRKRMTDNKVVDRETINESRLNYLLGNVLTYEQYKIQNGNSAKRFITHKKQEYRLSCEFCKKNFKHTGDLNKHRRKHTGEQPYECSHCRQKFSHASNLTRHQIVHSGERPFQCKRCRHSFSRKDKLSQHLMSKRCRSVSK